MGTSWTVSLEAVSQLSHTKLPDLTPLYQTNQPHKSHTEDIP